MTGRSIAAANQWVRGHGLGFGVIAIVATTLHHADAQSGGTPGLPGGAPGGSPAEGFREAPHTLPPSQCQQLLTLRDELQKHGAAITAANDKRANVRIACPLFRIYIATEAKMLQALDTHGASCGVPAHVNEQVRGSHAKAQQMGKQVCDRVPPQPLYYDAPPFRKDHSGEGMNPIPRREPWPTRLSERR